MRKVCLGAVVLIAAMIVAAGFWVNRVGTFSYANYERIRPGMPLAEIERLLGGPGTEVDESELPHVVDRQVPADDPRRLAPVISGERYIRWEAGSSYIIVSLRGDLVAEMNYWEPSL